MNVRRKATRGVLWTALQDGATTLVSFLTVMVLARNIPPRQFGILAEAWAVVWLLSQLGRLGLVEAIVAGRERHRQLRLEVIHGGDR